MATSGLSFFLSFLSVQNRLWLFLLCGIAICSSPVRSLAQESAHSSGWVVIPIDEYRDLHARAYPAEHEAEPPSVDATLTRVDYDLRSNGEIATGRADLTVD
ncbi:MAG: hypothetical protein DMG97_31405, partial [Acidobacteria bacterium]